jgi:hypothetical protein
MDLHGPTATQHLLSGQYRFYRISVFGPNGVRPHIRYLATQGGSNGMDGEWFRAAHDQAGVSMSQACRLMKRSPTFLQRIYSGAQPLKLPQAQQLATILGVPLAEVLRRAGLSISVAEAVAPPPPGLPAGDVAQVHDVAAHEKVFAVGPQGPGQSLWTARSDDMRAAGVLAGDRLVVDAGLAPRGGDVVLACLQDWGRDAAVMLLRLYRPPYLLRPSLEAEAPLFVDGERVMIRGVMVALRRDRQPD